MISMYRKMNENMTDNPRKRNRTVDADIIVEQEIFKILFLI